MPSVQQSTAALVTLTPTTSVRNLIQPTNAAAAVPLVVKGAVGQTANLVEIRNSAGDVLVEITPAGAAYFAAQLETEGFVSYQPNRVKQTNVGDLAYQFVRYSSTFDDFRVFMDGKMEWGTGSAAQDVNLYREGANILATDDKLHVVGETEIDGALNHDGTTVGFYSVTPVARAAAIASPASDIVGTKAAIDAIRVALTNLGLTS